MALVRAQVVMERDTNLPSDVVVNTWHFTTTGDFTLPAQLDPIHTALAALYATVDGFFSQVLKEAATIRYYQVQDLKPNPPIEIRPLTLALDAGATPYPEEVAVCMSFSADPAAGAIAARRRGRVYFGPLAALGGSVVNGRVTIPSATRTMYQGAGQALLTASINATDWEWVIYSPTAKAAGASEGGYATPVRHGWIDDAFDTQRRRGPRPSTRTTFT